MGRFLSYMLNEASGKLDTFTRSYIETALWSSTGDDEQPLDKEYSINDIDEKTIEKMKKDCEKFQEENEKLYMNDTGRSGGDPKAAGHNFWLTRNGHGAGFWDGDYKENEKALTKAAKAFGEVDLYVGDDKKIHQS